MPQSRVRGQNESIIISEAYSGLRILYKDLNWGYITGYSTYQNYWRSRESLNGESAIGRLDLGYLILGKFLSFSIAGGGNTNGSAKSLKICRASDSTVLSTHTLNNLLATDTDLLKPITISTLNFLGVDVFLRFEDNDQNSGWAWIGFDLASFAVVD